MSSRVAGTGVGFVGLGAMGLPMARRLAEADEVDLRFFDRQPERLAEAPETGQRVGSVAAAASGADVVFTVLPADANVVDVVDEIAELTSPPKLLVDFSTVHPRTIERSARRLAAAGVQTVSASLARGTEAASAGTLVLFVGAMGELPAGLPDLLEPMASGIHLVPDLRTAKAVKLANNMVLSCLVVVAAEAVVLSHRLGYSAAETVAHLAEGGADSWALRNHVMRHMIPGDLATRRFGTRYMAKDLRLFLDWAVECGTGTALAGTAAACYRGTEALGYPDHYHPVVVRWFEHIAAVDRGSACRDAPPAGYATSEPGAVITAAVVAVQALASREALTALAYEGLPPSDAAAYLSLGSAANDALRTVAGSLAPGSAPFEPAVLGRQLTAVLALADRAEVPALMFEAGRQAAGQAAREAEGPPTAT